MNERPVCMRSFRRNGVLAMLERDILTKKCPQRWQDLTERELQGLDVILCFDDRIFEIVLEDLQLRLGGDCSHALHLLCLDTKDTPEHAKLGGALALELCQAVRGGGWGTRVCDSCCVCCFCRSMD